MPAPDSPINDLYTKLIQGLHAEAKNQGHKQAVLGLSGGLNSAVALCLAVRAFGPRNVTALILPELGLTPSEDADHARKLAKHFGVKFYEQPINNFLMDYQFVPWKTSVEAKMNVRTRVRSTLLKQFIETNPALLIGTTCKSDLLLGWGQKDGEWAGDLLVLGDCFKTEVIELGRWIGLPEELFEKKSSRHLYKDQTDEGDLGGTWNQVDDVLKYLSCGADPEFLIQKGIEGHVVHKIGRLLEENKKSMQDLKVLSRNLPNEAIKKAQAVEAATLF